MSTINDGGPAFPSIIGLTSSGAPDYRAQGNSGMTLRDWLAGQALAGYCANQSTMHRNAHDAASYIWELADAMLAARNGGAS